MIKIIKSIIKKINILKVSKVTNSKISTKANITMNTSFEGKNNISNNVILDSCDIGYGTYIGNNSVFYKTSIGRYCSIANDVKVVAGIHPTEKLVSTHPAFYSIRKQAGFTYVDNNCFDEEKCIPLSNYVVTIGNDVWIGESVKIMPGIKVGDGAIIGAGAIVTKDINPYTINVGVPAKVVNKRFSNEEINFLLKYQWWNNDERWIRDNVDKFLDIKKFIELDRGDLNG